MKKLLLVLALLASCRRHPKTVGPELAMADAFVDSVGINTHFSYTDSIYYQQFALIKQALLDLKVRHIRDGMHTTPSDLNAMHNQLGQAGIRCLYVVDPRLAASVVLNYPTFVNDMEALENNNEADAAGGVGWVQPLKDSMSALYAEGQSLHLPVVGPSLVNQSWWSDGNSFRLLGDQSKLMNFNNLHNYMGSYHPESRGWGGGCTPDGYCYGSIQWNISQAALDGPGVPIWTTENGYTINPAKPSTSIPQTVFATYLPRLLLDQWNAGILRTYIYELADDPSTACCMGLLDATGKRRTPFTALQNLLTLLSDKGPAIPLKTLSYTISGAPDTLQHALFQKRDNSYWLALWQGVPGYDPHSYQMQAATPMSVTVTWEGKTGGSRIYKWDTNGNLHDLGHKDGNSVSVNVDDNLALLKIAMS